MRGTSGVTQVVCKSVAPILRATADKEYRFLYVDDVDIMPAGGYLTINALRNAITPYLASFPVVEGVQLFDWAERGTEYEHATVDYLKFPNQEDGDPWFPTPAGFPRLAWVNKTPFTFYALRDLTLTPPLNVDLEFSLGLVLNGERLYFPANKFGTLQKSATTQATSVFVTPDNAWGGAMSELTGGTKTPGNIQGLCWKFTFSGKATSLLVPPLFYSVWLAN